MCSYEKWHEKFGYISEEMRKDGCQKGCAQLRKSKTLEQASIFPEILLMLNANFQNY
jgi:hypothetical protein